MIKMIKRLRPTKINVRKPEKKFTMEPTLYEVFSNIKKQNTQGLAVYGSREWARTVG